MPSLENIRAARAATDQASAEFRALCVAALDDYPLRQVAIAANVSRDTLYAWKLQASQNALAATPADTEEPQR
jgi:transposase-like protein